MGVGIVAVDIQADSLLAGLRLVTFSALPYFFFFEAFFLAFFAFLAAMTLTPFVDRDRSRGQVFSA